MERTVQFGIAILVAVLVGGLATRLFVGFKRALAQRRRGRRVVLFVGPTFLGNKFPSLPEAEAQDVGANIHHLFRDQEDYCEMISLRELPRMGEKAPRCYEMMGRVLALLEALSSCAWGCAKGDHVLERLVARAVNHGRAGLRLALMGFYDEALVLIRGVGEIANLLSLFERRSGLLDQWKSLDERTRRRNFSPANVRAQLETLGTPIRISAEVYSELSSRNVHVNPRTSPQTYDQFGRPKGGGFFQDAGLLICENELAKALTFVAYSAAQLSHLDQSLKKRVLMAGRDLIANAGALDVGNLDEMWTKIKAEHSVMSN